MKAEDFKIDIIESDGVFTASLNHSDFTGIVVQVDNFEDIVEELSSSFKATLNHFFIGGNYTITKL